MKYTIDQTFEILIKELHENASIRGYYRLLNNKSLYEYRKSYFYQRLEYVQRNLTKPGAKVWDIGCGYGTTGFMLALNGFEVVGSTLEYYYNEIETRKTFWSQYGDISGFTVNYENIFDIEAIKPEFDYIILQDTMHHLEPVEKAAEIIGKALKPDGKVIMVEVNGNCIVENVKQYLRRGNKRIVEVYDEKLNKKYLMGDENFKSLKEWATLFEKQQLKLIAGSNEYTRLFPPIIHNNWNHAFIENTEKKLAKKSTFIREYGYLGLSFMLQKE
jgi:2-polyprenyl-3-methyl-5-hydroxy-6-metoxy-1,4-benzoquinol methylase